MKQYRTEEQFISIMENAQNGNWSDAFKEAAEAGFYAQDLIRHWENIGNIYGFLYKDLVYIAEGAQKYRDEN